MFIALPMSISIEGSCDSGRHGCIQPKRATLQCCEHQTVTSLASWTGLASSLPAGREECARLMSLVLTKKQSSAYLCTDLFNHRRVAVRGRFRPS